MHHDGKYDDCNSRDFIMSQDRGTHGQTQWSECSEMKLKSKATKRRLKCLSDRPRCD